MNLTERKALVADLEKHGFRTVRCTADMDGDGIYNETFERPNEDPSEIADRITVEWSKRGPVEVPPDLDAILESINGDRCPALCTDTVVTRGARDDGWRCGLPRGHGGIHTLYTADGEGILGTMWGAWRIPDSATAGPWPGGEEYAEKC